MVVIEVKGYGDFDMPYTESVWALDCNEFDESSIQTDVRNTRAFDEIHKELKSLGFRKVKTKTIEVGGNC